MTIKTSGSKLHWNYFLALERDIEAVSRFIEFDPANFDVFSIELARLLFAAASEVDVMAKLICRQVDPDSEASSINAYKTALVPAVPTILTTAVNVPRYGLTLQPWENWQTPGDQSHPDWWNAYNKVKHHRSTHFHRATLANTLNALAGLLVINFEFYHRELSPQGQQLHVKDVTAQLEPTTALFRFDDGWYQSYELREN
jgi:hypothetical protein